MNILVVAKAGSLSEFICEIELPDVKIRKEQILKLNLQFATSKDRKPKL